MFRSAIATLVAGAALATGVSVAPPSSTPASALGSSSARSGATACERVWEALPPAMQDDIRAALSLPGREQQRALLAVRYAALHGSYGDQVERWAKALQHRRAELWKTLPPQLRADVLAARSLPYREQRRAMTAIRTAALQGAYGDRVQQLAQQLAQRRQTFLEGCPDEIGSYVADQSDPIAG
jgi:hypothetical protein